MRLQDHIDFTTLQWVKPELDETLAAARDALESYVDNPGNRDAMRSCADSLHQVHGTLQMVELYGAAMVADEMETLAIALLEDHVPQREEAYASLMRGLMQLPDYLERLSSGHRDVPVVLLPLLNELRASRKMAALTEVALFNPRLDAPLPPQAPPAVSEEEAHARRGRVADLRLRFQQQLLAWFRGQNADQQLLGMRDTLNAITGCCHSTPGRRLWWIAAGALEGLEQGHLKAQAAEVRQLIGKVDRNIRLLIEQGEDSLRGGDADDVACKLLYIVAQAKQRSPQMELLRETRRPVTEICFDVGFTSLGTFSRTFREIVGESPSDYRQGHGPIVAPHCVQLAAMRPRMTAGEAKRLSRFGEAVPASVP